MTTRTDVFNLALNHLESKTIVSADNDMGKFATRMRSVWDQAVRASLQVHEWNFAIQRAQLAKSAETPVTQYDYAFVEPQDWLATERVTDDPDCSVESPLIPYAHESGQFLTNHDPTYVRYVSDRFVTELGSWPALFVDFVALQLASYVMGHLSPSADVKQQVREDLRRARALAIAWDGKQNPPKTRAAGEFTRARRGYSVYGGRHWNDRG